MKKESILTYLTDVKNKYEDEGFIIKALFGSYSRDEADVNSDVDILEDSITQRPAILMYLTAIAEQFNKLKQEHADGILSAFDDGDVKGMYDVRTYIAYRSNNIQT